MNEEKKLTPDQIENILKLQVLHLKAKLNAVTRILNNEPPAGKTKLDILLETFSIEELAGITSLKKG